MFDQLPRKQRQRIHVFSCLFYTKLTEGKNAEASHKLVSRWTKNVNLFDKDFVLVPVNKKYHWSLTVIVRPGLLLVRCDVVSVVGALVVALYAACEERGA